MAVVRFHRTSENDSVEDVVQLLEAQTAVHELSCSEILKDEDVEYLDVFLKSRMAQVQLQCLKLPKNNLSPMASLALAHIIETTQTLRELDLSDNLLLGEGFTALVRALVNPSCRLVKLNISSNRIGPKGASAFSSLIRQSKSLEDLNLAKNSLGTKAIKMIVVELCENTTLLRLDLTQNNVSDRGASHLATALDPELSKSRLQQLDLTCNKIGPTGAHSLAHALLTGNKSLQHLNLSLNRVGPDGAAAFGAVLKYSHTLQDLNLSRNNVAEGVMQLLEGLQESEETDLRRLDLSWNSLRDNAAVRLASLLRGNGVLQSLNLASNAIGTQGIISLAKSLPYDVALRELDIVGNQAEDSSAAVLATVLCRPDCKLEILRWEHNNFTVEGKKRMEAAFVFRENLKKWLGRYLKEIETRRVLGLDLSSKYIGDDEVIAISHHVAKYHPHVLTLVLSGDRLTSRGVIGLTKEVLSPNAVKVDRLYVSDSAAGDSGAGALAQALLTNTSLTVLSLMRCEITADGARMLANALRRNRTVARLNLRGNRIGDNGARELWSGILERPDCSIRALNLSKNGISDRGLLFSTFATLEELHLGENEITDFGALDIAKACIGADRLHWLNVSCNRISPKGIQALRLFVPSSTMFEHDELQTNGTI